MNMIKKAALAATVAGAVVSAGAAEAMNLQAVDFSYTFSNRSQGLAQIIGTLVGEVNGDNVINPNLSLSSAQFNLSQGGLTPVQTEIDLVLTNASPFTLDTANPISLDLQFTDNSATDFFSVDSTPLLFASASSVANGFDIRDFGSPLGDGFGFFVTSAPQDTGVPIPTPALLPGLLAMGAAARRRLSNQDEAA